MVKLSDNVPGADSILVRTEGVVPFYAGGEGRTGEVGAANENVTVLFPGLPFIKNPAFGMKGTVGFFIEVKLNFL